MKKLIIFLALLFAAQAHAYNVVKLNPVYVPNPAKGSPISLGKIYVGEPDTDPTVLANQITLYVQEEDGDIVSVTQPITLGAGGVPLYNGSPVTLLVNTDYSLAILNSSGSQIYYIPSDHSTATSSLLSAHGCDIETRVAEIEASAVETTLIVDCSPTITDGNTVTTNYTDLQFYPGKIISGTAGGGVETLSLNGKFSAGSNQQIFGDDLIVTSVNIGSVYVAWWGALPGNTASSNTSAIQKADDFLTTVGGGVLIFGQGAYLYTALTPGQFHAWEGQGKAGVTTLQSTYAGNTIVLNHDVTIKDMTLDGVSNVAGSSGLSGAAKHRVVLERVEIKDFETAINLTGGIFWRIDDCNIHGNVDGLKVITSGTGFNNNNINSTKFVSNTGKGVWLQYGGSDISTNSFYGNDVEDNGYGYYFLGVYNTKIDSNFMEGQSIHHIYTDDILGKFTTGLTIDNTRLNIMDPGGGVSFNGDTQKVSAHNNFLFNHDWINNSPHAVRIYDTEIADNDMVFGDKIVRIASTATWAENISISDGNSAFRRYLYEDGELQQRFAQVQTTDATVTTLHSFSLSDEKAYVVEAVVLAQQSDGSERSEFHIEGLFFRDGGGNATQEGITTPISEIKGDALMACEFDVSGAQVLVRVTGLAGKTFNWTTLKLDARAL